MLRYAIEKIPEKQEAALPGRQSIRIIDIQHEQILFENRFVRALCSEKGLSLTIQIITALNAKVGTSIAVHRWFYATLAVTFLAAWSIVQLIDFVLLVIVFQIFSGD